jgi:protein-S-isoprenylcysteine O-methyltransferase Ste14
MTRKDLAQAIYGWRIRVANLVLLPVIILSRPTKISIPAGLAACFLGIYIRAWASGHIRKEKELTVSGPYRYTRNPLYFGNFVLGISMVVGANSWWCLLIFAAYFLMFYPPVIKEERIRMRLLFPDKYEEYKKRVPAFFPSLKPGFPPGRHRFSWSLYKKNKEYRALAGAVVFWLILAGKMLLFP